MEKKIALISGGNRGLGLEIGRQLGKLGVTILLGARTEESGSAAADQLVAEGIEADFISLDITDEASILKVAERVTDKFGRLDILINNAGMQAKNQAPSVISADLLRSFINTNFIGHVLLTQALLPLLKASQAGRIVNMSSSIGSMATMGDSVNTNPRIAAATPLGYSSSKAALNMFTILLAKELKQTSIKVNSADPGRTQTDMGGSEAPNTIAYGARPAVWLACLDENGPTGGFFSHNKVNPW
jgi:NAD(P)-dependent dehydrogenase (short-subunit alcohol dehydrogenase family)